MIFEMINKNLFQIVLSSVAQLCLTLCDQMDCNTLDFPVHYQLSELAQTCVHRVSDAIQPSHPLESGGQSIGASASASVLPMNIHD